MIDKAIVYQVKTYNPEWWNKCEERQASCLLCKHTFQIMAWRERQMHLCRTLLEGQSLLFSTCRQKSFEMSILFIFWWLPPCPDLSTTSYLSSEPWSLLINHLVKTSSVQVNLDILYWFWWLINDEWLSGNTNSTSVDFFDNVLTFVNQSVTVNCCHQKNTIELATCGLGASCAGSCSALGASLSPSGNCTGDCEVPFEEGTDETEAQRGRSLAT